jgi:cyclophilin family peptidyl-prolyl cis-trans isomerase/HEAT repeat protein
MKKQSLWGRCRLAQLAVPVVLASSFPGCSDVVAYEAALANNASELSADASAARRRSAILHEIREIEDHRLLGSAQLRNYTQSRDATIARAALTAIGRIGDTTLLADVLAAQSDRRGVVREKAAFALGMLAGPEAASAVRTALAQETHVPTRAALVTALGRIGDDTDVALLSGALASSEDAQVNGAAAQALGMLARTYASATPPIVIPAETFAQLLTLAADASSERATPAAFALANLPGDAATVFPEAVALSAFQNARSASTRQYLSRVLRRLASPAASNALIAASASESSIPARAEIARQITRLPWSDAIASALDASLSDAASQVVVAVLEGLTAKAAKATEAAALTAHVRELADGASSTWIRASAVASLVAINPDEARPSVELALQSSERQLRVAAISALGVFASDADLATLSGLLNDPDPRIVSPVIDTLAGFDASRFDASLVAALKSKVANRDTAVFGSIASLAGTLLWTDLAEEFALAYDEFEGPAEMDGRITVLSALGALGDATYLPVVERGLLDAERNVVQAAADAYLAITKTDVSAKIPLVSKVSTETPSARKIARALGKTVVLVTSRGTITLRMQAGAALTATNFVKLVESGFYDGLTFHRVVSDFVAQGGDPRGDGYGGADELIREEVGLSHQRGTVGMATAGKDTGSAQFFFNHGWNVHLDGNYTGFAEVVSGLHVIDRLEVGDVIRRAVAY